MLVETKNIFTPNKFSAIGKCETRKFRVWGIINHRPRPLGGARRVSPLPLDPLVLEFMVVSTEEDDNGDDVVKSLS